MITCDHAFFLLFFGCDKKRKSAFLQVYAVSLVSFFHMNEFVIINVFSSMRFP